MFDNFLDLHFRANTTNRKWLDNCPASTIWGEDKLLWNYVIGTTRRYSCENMVALFLSECTVSLTIHSSTIYYLLPLEPRTYEFVGSESIHRLLMPP